MALSGKDAAAIQPVGLIPSTPMKAEKKTYASAMSFVGSTRRITAWIRRFGDSPAKAVAGWAPGITAMMLMWSFLVAWYVVIFGLFGLLTIPYRLIRRSQRKNVHLQEQQLATMQAMMVQQAQAAQAHPPTQ